MASERKEPKKDTPPVTVKEEEKVNILELCAQMAKEEGTEYMFSLVGGNSITPASISNQNTRFIEF